MNLDLDYLARDYESFRRLMLDHLPAGAGEPAGVAATLVEALAYVADLLAYYQDAVATEAYLATARRRVSVRRHLRLLGAVLGEAVSARLWAHFEVGADEVRMPRGTLLLTRSRADDPVRVTEDYAGEGREAFATLHHALLRRAHNRMALEARPEPGATEARLVGALPLLAAGDVLILTHSHGGMAHAVRLGSAAAEAGATAIAWHEEDALPAGLPSGGAWSALGNIVLADHGRPLATALPPLPGENPVEITVACPELLFARPYRHDAVVLESATAAMRQDRGAAEPAMNIEESAAVLGRSAGVRRAVWTGVRDLVHASQFERLFAVEPTGRSEAILRFGDGRHGRRFPPDMTGIVRYRAGEARRGNVGPNTLGHVVTDDARILGVSNPLPGAGGAEAEPIAEAELRAPFSAEALRRCVTEEDYAKVVSALPGVAAARAERQWQAGGSKVGIEVQRSPGRLWSAAYEERLRRHLEPFRLIGDDLTLVDADLGGGPER